ncbi:MAG: hypothetical protein HY290_32260 [Planctomycetia bacterium]|nr:hypothetical protein [Planctomycetia bacterium]
MAEPIESTPTCRFRPRHDLWDAVDFYLYFFALAQFAGYWLIWMACREMESPQPTPWVWLLLPAGVLQSLYGIVRLVLHVWQRFAEGYELTATELVIDHGYMKVRVPFGEIYGANPCKICRMTATLKQGVRVKYSNPQTRWGSVDLAPSSLDLFLSELSARCPHLRREGPRLLPPEAASVNPPVCA